MVWVATWLLACGGKAIKSGEFDETEGTGSDSVREDAVVMDAPSDTTSGTDPPDVEPPPSEPDPPDPPVDSATGNEGSLAEVGMACERDADCSTDFCDVGVCWEPHAMAERAGETGPVYAAGHGAFCDRATPCQPYTCQDGRCRY